MRKNIKRHVFLYIIIALFLCGCSLKSNGGTETEQSNYAVTPSNDSNYENLCSADLLQELRDELERGERAVSLEEITDICTTYIDRSDVASPYLKIDLPDERLGFVFYNDRKEVSSILITEGFLSWEDMRVLESGRSSYYDVLRLDSVPILSPISVESITGHILQEGVCVIRCSNFNRKIISIEYFTNEELNGRTLYMYGMTIPYILPEDKYEHTNS